jgi:hypothetical protein
VWHTMSMTEFFNTQYGGRRPGRTAEYYAGDESVGPRTEEPEPYSWLFRKRSAAEGVAGPEKLMMKAPRP